MAEYIEREALLEDIENTLVFSGRTGSLNPRQIGAQMVVQRIKAALAAEVAPVVPWISVKDKKPKQRGSYFVAYKFAGSDMYFYGTAMWHDDIPDNGYVQGDHFSNEGVDGMHVTHWMKIPSLPKPLDKGGADE